MPSTDGEAAFERWLEDVSRNSDAPTDDRGDIDPGWQRWLRDFFERSGATPKHVVTQAATAHVLALANASLAAVLDDLYRTTGARPTSMVRQSRESSLRLVVDGSEMTVSDLGAEQPEILVHVAEDFQELYYGPVIAGNFTCWPECAQHRVGLHPEIHEGTAVWQCRLGRHSVAAIGELGADA